MNKIIMFKNNMYFKKGLGMPLLIDRDVQYKKGSGISPVVINDKKDELMFGKGVVLNKPLTSGRKKPLKLNL